MTKDKHREVYHYRKNNNLCVKCGLVPPNDNQTKCEPCRVKHNEIILASFHHNSKIAGVKRALLVKQENKCAICSKSISKRSHLDHNHITRNIRGILCLQCNMLLGFAKADEGIDLLINAIRYIKDKDRRVGEFTD